MHIQAGLLALATFASGALVTPVSPCEIAVSSMMNVVSACKIPTPLKAGDKLTIEQNACICLPANQASVGTTIKDCSSSTDALAASATSLANQLSEGCKNTVAPVTSGGGGPMFPSTTDNISASPTSSDAAGGSGPSTSGNIVASSTSSTVATGSTFVSSTSSAVATGSTIASRTSSATAAGGSQNSNGGSEAAQGLSGGAIAGIIAGVLVLVGLISGLIYWFRSKKDAPDDDIEKLDVGPLPSTSEFNNSNPARPSSSQSDHHKNNSSANNASTTTSDTLPIPSKQAPTDVIDSALDAAYTSHAQTAGVPTRSSVAYDAAIASVAPKSLQTTNPEDWSVEQCAYWAKDMPEFGTTASWQILNKRIRGRTLLTLTRQEMQSELGLAFGEAAEFQRSVSTLLARGSSVAMDAPPVYFETDGQRSSDVERDVK
ncbi:hypothetical protein HDU80_007642 [Chytriomyces hyalinus]|nr:hypothetical protein HDU80_007642 [Chytriomyces hyalinus]